MKTQIDQANGVTTVMRTFKSNSTTTESGEVYQTNAKVFNASAFTAVNLLITMYACQLGTGADATNSPILHLETTMQNDQDEGAPLWISLATVNLYSTFTGSSSSSKPVKDVNLSTGLLGYLRWRIEVPSRTQTQDVDLALTFQITGYGIS